MVATLANRVRVSTSTTGAGTVTLGSNVAGWQTFAGGGVTDGQTVSYLIQDGNDWEVGRGVYTHSGTTMSRSVIESSNSDSAINLTGAAEVFITALKTDFIQSVSSPLAFNDATGALTVDLSAYQPLDSDLTSWASVTRASGFDVFAATPSSANLRTLLVDEEGAGAAYFVGGALGTPASATLTNGTGLPISGITGLGTGVAALLASNTAPTATITFVIDGGGSTITTGVKGDLEIPFACTITQVTMLADQSGSIVVDIWKDTYANFPPVDGDSITASAPPTISTATKSQDSTLSGWTTTISAGQTLRFNVDSVTSVQRVTISLRVTKT